MAANASFSLPPPPAAAHSRAWHRLAAGPWLALALLLGACTGEDGPAPAPPPAAAAPEAPVAAPDTAENVPVPALGGAAMPVSPPASPQAPEAPAADAAAGGPAFALLGTDIPAGTSTRLMWSPSKIFEGMASETPVLVVHGRKPGPVLCITAAVHGDELNGIEIVRRVFQDLDPKSLAGTAIGVPIVNIHGFRRGARYLPDRRDLNRFFPGNPQGSSAARIAHSLFENILRRCTALVDLHTGSFARTNLPQVRADLGIEPVADLAHGFGGMLVLNSEASPGTLRRAATDAGIPAVILEAGEPLRLQPKQVEQGVAGIRRLLAALGMTRKATLLGQPEPVYYRSRWVRADHGGVLASAVRLGQTVRPGDILGNVTDPITNEQNLIRAPVAGRVIGMAVNQIVMPGFAAFHLGTEAQPARTVALARAPDKDKSARDRDVAARDATIAEGDPDTE